MTSRARSRRSSPTRLPEFYGARLPLQPSRGPREGGGRISSRRATRRRGRPRRRGAQLLPRGVPALSAAPWRGRRPARRRRCSRRTSAVALLNKGNLDRVDRRTSTRRSSTSASSVPTTDGAPHGASLRDLAARPRRSLPATSQPAGSTNAARAAARSMEIRYTPRQGANDDRHDALLLRHHRQLRRLNQSDPTTVDEACGMYAGGAALFSVSGISFAIGARFLAHRRSGCA